MKIDWDKDTGKWNIRELDSEVLIARVGNVKLKVPSELVITNGGRHGYLVTAGTLKVQNDIATITKE